MIFYGNDSRSGHEPKLAVNPAAALLHEKCQIKDERQPRRQQQKNNNNKAKTHDGKKISQREKEMLKWEWEML